MPLHFMYATRGNRRIGRTDFAKGISRASLAWLHVILLPLFLHLLALFALFVAGGIAPNIISLAFIHFIHGTTGVYAGQSRKIRDGWQV